MTYTWTGTGRSTAPRTSLGRRKVIRLQSNAGELATRLEVYASSVASNSTRVVMEAATAALDAVVRATPVDKGDAKSNWLIGLNSPRDGEVIPAYASGRHGSTAGACEAGAMAAGRAEIAKYRARGAGSIWLSNSVPYIRKLTDEGWSRQQPGGGWAEAAILSAADQVRNATLL